MPQLSAADETLGAEAARVRAYLELMHLRLPDRLAFELRIDAAVAAGGPPPPYR
jgi:sensor histidine kinase YesM